MATATPIPQPFVASGASHAAGLVPDPGVSAGTTKFLCEDATFKLPSGGATITGPATSIVASNGSGNGVGTSNATVASDGTAVFNGPVHTNDGLILRNASYSGAFYYINRNQNDGILEFHGDQAGANGFRFLTDTGGILLELITSNGFISFESPLHANAGLVIRSAYPSAHYFITRNNTDGLMEFVGDQAVNNGFRFLSQSGSQMLRLNGADGSATFSGSITPGSINTATTPGTAFGQIVADNSGGANTGHFWGWNGASWLPLG